MKDRNSEECETKMPNKFCMPKKNALLNFLLNRFTVYVGNFYENIMSFYLTYLQFDI